MILSPIVSISSSMATQSEALAPSRHVLRIAKLQWCHDVDCKIASDLSLHLKIEYATVEIIKSFAVAISYTWGEFDRTDFVIGHDAAGNVISMNLGSEWDIQDTINTLVHLCLENGEKQGPEHAGVWMDQLCVRQSDDNEIRATLASIPAIYRSLDVVALMPGGLCSCLPRIFQRLEAGTPPSLVANLLNDMLGGDMSMHSLPCLNAVGLCSYFDRVWTRQELLYSGAIRIVRTSPEELRCVRDETQARHLSRFGRQFFLHCETENRWAFGKLLQRNAAFFMNAWDAVEGLKRADTRDEGSLYTRLSTCRSVEKFTTLIGFLLGRNLERPERYTEGTDVQKVIRFLGDLEILGGSTRKATKVRDYIVSVWVDCPGYVVPANYKLMDSPSLLEDAVSQLEKNYSVTVQTSWVPGFSTRHLNDSALWRPTKYLGRRPIQAADEIYSVVLSHIPVPVILDRKVPLLLSRPLVTPLSGHARSYREYFAGRHLDDILEELKIIIQFWESKAERRNRNFLMRKMVLRDGYSSSNLFKMKLLEEPSRNGSPLEPTEIAPRLQQIRIRPDFSHYQAVYEMVTIGLGLNASDCQNAGLTLMVIPGQYIGLTAKEVGMPAAAEDAVTIRTDSTGCGAMLEATLKEYGQPNVYGITGIWIPRENAHRNAYSATVNYNEYNALLE